jgi:hypothetical protein
VLLDCGCSSSINLISLSYPRYFRNLLCFQDQTTNLDDWNFHHFVCFLHPSHCDTSNFIDANNFKFESAYFCSDSTRGQN